MLKKSRFLIILILLALFIHGCELQSEPVETPQETNNPPAPVSAAPTAPERYPSEPGQFTIRYVPDSPVNPITSLTRDNIVLSSLLYEGLFTLDGNLNAEPVLCESWSTEDGLTYELVIKQNIAMNDGSFLTADDVVYTLEKAMQTGRFVHRLGIIKSVETEEDLTVTIELKYANKHFIEILDVPIIKDGSIDEFIPPGTGPFMFANSGALRLIRFYRYRDFAELPITEIVLLECDDNEMAELFDSGALSLLWDDPSDTFNVILNRHNELRHYDTTVLQYLGFNTRSIILSDADVRRAIGSSLNRQYIAETIMPGQSLVAQLALSPAYRLYDSAWEQMVVDPLREMSALMKRAGLEDFDNDSFLEYPDGFGGFIEISIDFIVNSENSYKAQAAHRIADTLKLYGIEIIVRELPWDSYLAALESGEFDMYYGEVMLGADFDLSALLLPESNLNYGLTGSEYFRPFVESFLAARTDYEEKAAAELLCDEINLNAPFVPVLYKKYAVYTPIGAIHGAMPSQTGVFSNFASWSIDLTMLP